MSTCPACVPWNFPLHFTRAADGAVRVMSFQENIAYRLHINHHQSPAMWQGEIDQYTKELLDDSLLPA